MVDGRTSVQRRSSTVPFTSGLSVILCCLASSISFADVPFQGNRPASSAGLETGAYMTGAYMKNDRMERDPIIRGGPCFSVGSPLKWPQHDGKLDVLVPPPTVACIELVAAADEIGWAGYEAQGDHARSVGNWQEAEKAYGMAVGLLDRTADKDLNQGLAALLNKLGAARFKQNDFPGAETVFRRALTIYTSARGADDLHVADTLDLVASALFEQQQGRALAGPLFFRAWAIRDGTLGPDHPVIADSLHHLAVSLYSDNLSLAIPLFLRSRDIREKIFGHDHPLVANSLNAMARLYEKHNRPDLAIPLYQAALTIQEKVFGPNASETQQIRSSLNMAHGWKDHPHEGPNGR